MDDRQALTPQASASEAGAGQNEGDLVGLIGRVLGQLSGGRVLDVATGEGGFVGLLRQYLGDYVNIIGVDWDLEALIRAREAIQEEAVGFCQMDAEHLAFGDGAFDTVNISASLHHLPSPERALSEMARVTKPGGQLVIEEMHRDGQAEPQRVAVGIHHWAAEVDRALGIPHYPTLGRKEMVDLVEGLGLEEVRCFDWADLDSDPQDEALSDGVTSYMERRLQQAEGRPEYEVLAAQNEALRLRMRQLGIQREPVIIIVARKIDRD